MGTISFFQDGGPFMCPILFVFAFGVAIAIERWMYLTCLAQQPVSVEEDRAVSQGRQLPGSCCGDEQVESGDRFESDVRPVSR